MSYKKVFFVLVSVIVVVKNEENYIEKCLKSLICQDYPFSKYEILVVDGMSTDGTRGIVIKFKQKYANNIKLLDNPKGSYPSGLNVGVRHSRGEIIIKIDGHVYVAKNFISKSVEYLQKTDAVCVGGPIKTIGQGFIGKTIALVLSSPFGVGGAKFRCFPFYEGYADTVPFGAYQKKIFNQVGFYDENRFRTEDLDLHSRIRKKGGKFYLTSEIKSYYYSRATIKELIKQAFSNGYEIITALHAISLRHIVPFVFIVSLLLFLSISLFIEIGKYLLLSTLLVYLSVAIFFSVLISVKKGIKYILILPIIFFVFHFSYGLGSLWSIISKIKKIK